MCPLQAYTQKVALDDPHHLHLTTSSLVTFSPRIGPELMEDRTDFSREEEGPIRHHRCHLLAAWKDILRGNPVRARQVLKKIVAGPIRMEPLPEVQGYRWQGQLNGGAVSEGTQKHLKVRGDGPIIVQDIRSPRGHATHLDPSRSLGPRERIPLGPLCQCE